MSHALQLLGPDPLQAVAALLFSFAVYSLAGFLPVCAVMYVVYFLLTLPMRRNERARLFVDLLELGLNEGRTPEAAIVGAAASRDRSLGARFHLLAAYLESGMPWNEALEHVPRLLPPQVSAMLGTGARIGGVAKVLPACRQLLNDAVSQVRGALNYLILLAFVVTPFTLLVTVVLKVRVLPKYTAVFRELLEQKTLPAFTRMVFGTDAILIGVQIAIIGLLWLAMLAYVGGPRLRGWLNWLLPGLSDRIQWQFPWRRKRLQRDFSAILAILLEAQVPEPEAVNLAGQSTANIACLRRAGKAAALLKDGIRLPQAIRAVDDSKEFGWRLANALRRGSGFLRALAGWHETLDARAFQLEQSAAQLTTTALVLLNGLFVASVVIAVFLALIQILNEAVLW